MNKNTLAKNLRQLRRLSGNTQDEWAEILDVGPGSISNAERSECWPHRYTLYKIAEMFNLEVHDLFRPDLFRKGEIVREPTKITVSPELLNLHKLIEGSREFAEFCRTVSELNQSHRELLIATAKTLRSAGKPTLEHPGQMRVDLI